MNRFSFEIIRSYVAACAIATVSTAMLVIVTVAPAAGTSFGSLA